MSVNVKQTYQAKPTNPTIHPPIALTNFDARVIKIYILSYYFFKNVDNKEGFMDHHKIFSSLEDILSDYYPLAGRLRIESGGRLSISYSDQGVPFVIAESPDITIKKLEERNWENDAVPNGLLPVGFKAEHDGPLLAVQHTTLADGVALGVAVHHSVTDSNGIFSFIENWGRKTRKESFTPPVHDRSLLKASGNPPSKEHPEFMVLSFLTNTIKNYAISIIPVLQLLQIFSLPKVEKKIFYFSKDNLKTLHDTYPSNDSTDSWTSTNDAFVAHISRTVAKARGIPLDEQVFCSFAVDVRKKVNPPLPPSYFGNAVLDANPKILVSELINEPQSKIALTVQKGHTEINDSEIRSTLDWLEKQPHIDRIMPNLSSSKDLYISNWSKFPIYALDFGYGTPIKYRTVKESLIGGFATVIGTPADDGGIEMYINLSPEQMRNLEQDPEFKMFQ